jgi:hypothetical protein
LIFLRRRWPILRYTPNGSSWSKVTAREEFKWQNIDADDLPAAVKKSFDAMVEAEG